MHGGPRDQAAEQNERESRDLRAPAALDERDEKADDAHREPVDRQRVDEDVDVFGLAEILAECGKHKLN